MQSNIRCAQAATEPGYYVTAARPDEPIQRIEFLAAQGAVLFASYVAFHLPGVYITISDVLFGLSFFIRLWTGRLALPFGSMTWLWILGVALLILGLFIGSVVNGDMLRGAIIIAQYGFAFVLVPLALLGRPLEQTIRLMKCAALGVVIMCLIGFAVYMTGYTGSGGAQMEIVSGNRRLAGFTDNPNGMAILTLLPIPLVWFLMISKQMRKGTAYFFLAVLVTGIFLTSSNTGLIGLIIAILVFFLGRRNLKTLLLVAATGAALFYFGQNYLPETFQNRVLTPVSSGYITAAGTFADRQKLAEEAIAMSEQHILIGVGADRYRLVSEWGQPVHNTYLLLLVEGGALSLFGLLIIIAAALLTVLTSQVRPFGGLVVLTTFTIVVVFANLLNGVAHIYGRCWLVPLLLALSPAVTATSGLFRYPDWPRPTGRGIRRVTRAVP